MSRITARYETNDELRHRLANVNAQLERATREGKRRLSWLLEVERNAIASRIECQCGEVPKLKTPDVKRVALGSGEELPR